MSAPRKNLAGRTFGALRVVARFRQQQAGWTWICWCLACGEVQDRLHSHLTGGHRTNCRTCKAKGRPRLASSFALPPAPADLERFRAGFGDVDTKLERGLIRLVWRARSLAVALRTSGLPVEFAEVAEDLAREIREECR